MNSYNENLHSSVVSTLLSQRQDLKKVASEANASMFTLYYAEGALITANDKLLAAKDQLDYDALVKLEAVNNSNLSNKTVASANQSNQYLKQSVTNTAVSAANVQIAASAIVKLASDVGSLYSIIRAADFDTDIHRLAKDVRRYINETAYEAEFASQLAMEASVITSSVSASTVLDRAKSNNTAMNNLLKIASAGFDTASQLVIADNANLAAISANEKVCEALYEDASVDFKAAGAAYEAANDGLNLGLTATPVKDKEDSTFQVKFNLLNSPFTQEDDAEYYPVRDYYLFVVKDKQKSTFSITNAEIILRDTEQKQRYIALSDFMEDNASDGQFEAEFNYKEILGADTLMDTDGIAVETGTKYVVFVVAVLVEEYKKNLNSYDDFLSSPSAEFCFVNRLAAAHFENPMEVTISKPVDESDDDDDKTEDIRGIAFTVKENPEFNVEYRCVFLPVSNTLTKANLNDTSIKEHNDEIDQIKKIADEFDPAIVLKEAQVVESRAKIKELTGGKPVAGHTSPELKKLLKNHRLYEKELGNMLNDKNAAIAAINENPISKIDFIFNLAIAEQIPAGNYIPAIKGDGIPGAIQKKGNSKDKKSKPDPLTVTREVEWLVPIEEGTTDNFGNVLISGNHYVPVILSVSNASENNRSRFANAWTGYDNSPFLEF